MNTQQLGWSDRIAMCERNEGLISSGPGVYIITVDNDGLAPLPILRKNGRWDYNGVMYLGGTPTSGSLRDRFHKHLAAHTDGMNGKIEKDGSEQNLVALWRDIRSAYPSAGLSFQYCELCGYVAAGMAEKMLQAAYMLEFGENPESGKESLLHNPQHLWRAYLREYSLNAE